MVPLRHEQPGFGSTCGRPPISAVWEAGGTVWRPTPGTWNAETTNGGIWAPNVVSTDRGFYLYYTANTRVGVARSDSPLGPFVDLYDHPFVGAGYGGVGNGIVGEKPLDLEERAIDANVLEGEDGSLTLYFVANDPLSTIEAIPMIDYETLADEPPTRLLAPTDPWEGIVCEGPFAVEHDGRVHLGYSGNAAPTVDYAIGGAVASSPLGPFERYPDNPLLAQMPDIELYGPGHHSLVAGAHDDLLIFYHTKSTSRPGYDRRIRYAPARFEDGELRVDPAGP